MVCRKQATKTHKMSLFKEQLFHFTCSKCKMWWSIAANNMVLYNKEFYCPWCSHKQKHKRVSDG